MPQVAHPCCVPMESLLLLLVFEGLKELALEALSAFVGAFSLS